jgi:hypothetical protein
MPAPHRRTFAAVYEMALACSFALLPFVAFLLADNPNAFRLMALPLFRAPRRTLGTRRNDPDLSSIA